MKNTFKKTLAVVLALIMLATAVPMAFAATEVANGTAGEGVNWVLGSDGTLTISGSGPIVAGWYNPPWEAYNDQILNIVIKEGITKIPGTAFCNAEKCVSISIPASVETIETSTTPFWGTQSLEKFVVDENNSAFKSVDGILFSKNGETLVFFPQNHGATEYTIPDTVKNIAKYAFFVNNCLEKVTVPDTVTSIGPNAFDGSEIKEISLGSGISEISSNCFSDTDIKSFVIPDSVTSLDYGVFYNCYELENLVIGSGVETIGDRVLRYTEKLSAVHYNGTKENWDKITISADNEYLMAKELHFVSEKEGVAPTCKDGNAAGLYCSECDEYFTGEVIPAVKDHNFNGDDICDSCNFVCNHETAEYVQTAETHQFKCDVCGKAEEPESHYIYNFKKTDENNCAPYCDVCGLLEGFTQPHAMTYYDTYDSENCIVYCENCGYENEETGLVPHSMTEYAVYDDEHCIVYCENCGYGDEEAGLVPHSMTEYAVYDDEYCIKVCENCGYGDEEAGLVEHSFDGGTFVPATETEAEYTRYTCVNCEYFYKEYNTENALVLKLYSEYEAQWEEAAILLYVNGEPVNLIRNMTGTEWDTFAMPYDKNSSYVFKWINGEYGEEFGVKIYLPDSEEAAFSKIDMSDYEMLQTIFTINVADYSDVDAALAKIPDYLEFYSANSVAALVTAVKGVERMLPAGKQAEVDAMAAAIENAVKGLVELGDPVPNGVINMSSGNHVYINDSYYSEKPGYAYYNEETGDELFYEYEGKYIILETEPKDEGNEDYVRYGIATYTGEVEFDLVNTFVTSYGGTFGAYDDSSVTLNLFGANAFAPYYPEDDDKAGIEIEEDAKLHIKDSNGSLVAIGQDDQAGIGSEEDEDNGEIVIDGGTIFALSLGDGAGIGSGNDGGAGKITINGGTIWAESMSDDGAGIGVGDGGEGGEIIINGGDITALSLDDNGAGIGGADDGYVDSITINGGNIVAGSEDGAAIGGGEEMVSFGGKITINGGNISASEWHDVDGNLIGNGNSKSKGESDDNFVQINGGSINASNSKGIYPVPKDKNGNVLVEKQITVHDSLIGKEITVELSNGSKITVTPENNEVFVYAPKDASVTNEADLAMGYCDHMCHRGGIMGFFWKIVNFFNKLFGLNPVCGCGRVHY